MLLIQIYYKAKSALNCNTVYISMDYDLEYSSAAFSRHRISISALNGAILMVVDLKLAERSSVKALVNLN